MSLLAALTLDLDLTMLPASSMPCRPELLKHRPPHAGHCELLAGPVDEGFALSMERPLLTGEYSAWGGKGLASLGWKGIVNSLVLFANRSRRSFLHEGCAQYKQTFAWN